MSGNHRWEFLKGYLSSPTAVGSVIPSSRALARAVCAPYEQRANGAVALEIGAGTGPVTRYLGTLLRDGDELDICEVHPDFADILERDVLTGADFRPRVAAGRVRLLRAAAQDIRRERHYDYIICGLPLTAFELRDVEAVFEMVRRSLKPGGIFSYYEYVGLRRASCLFALGRRRQRVRSVNAFLSEEISRHQFSAQTVVLNFLPAHTHHLRFDGRSQKSASRGL